MHTVKNIALLICMSFSTAVMAQKKQAVSMVWKTAAVLAQPLAGTIAGSSNQALVVAGGNNFPDSMPWMGGHKKYYDIVYVYTEINHALQLFPRQWKLPAAIAYAAVCSTPSGIVYAGGENETGASAKCGLLRWDDKLKAIVQQALPDLPFPLSNAAATAHGTVVYLAGGESTSGVSDHFYAIDINNAVAGWKQLPSIPAVLSHTVAVTASNGLHDAVFLLGGRRKKSDGTSEFFATVFAFDLVTGQWEQKKSLPYPIAAGAAAAYDHHHIVLTGGDKGHVFQQTELLIQAIANEKDPVKKERINQQKIQLQSTHPGFSKELLQYNTFTGHTVAAGLLPFNTPVTINAVRWHNSIIIAGGEIKAGVRTAAILKGSFIP